MKQVEGINERLASVSKEVLEQHRMNLACLVAINAPAGILEEAEIDLSDIEEEDLGAVEPLIAV